MRIVEGFDKARAALSRRAAGGSYLASPLLKAGTEDPEKKVREIIEKVKKEGDASLYFYTSEYDGVPLTTLEVDREKIAAAYRQVSDKLVSALRLAAERIRSFHQAQKDTIRQGMSVQGVGQLVRPLQRVGIYGPGGTAAYPSTVLMTAIPARVAGVKEVIMTTPPKRDVGVSPVTLVAADIAGVDRIFSIGGAQAIAAMAYGTQTIPAVDKVCGPGNIFVALAKRAVFGVVDIDALQGPSDVLIIADDRSNPEYCAAELLAQAEHDKLAEAHVVTTSHRLGEEVERELERQSKNTLRQPIVAESLSRGVIAVVDTMDEAVELANLYAPEHLCLMLENAAEYLDKITSAGCIVTGRQATVVLGDYVAGPSHALPTGGTARFSSPLNICDFLKFTSVIDTDKLDIKELAKAASIIARAEGLDAHARAAEMRLGRDK